MMVIFSFSARPAIQASSFDLLDFLIKKTAHFVEYFILTLLLSFSFKKTTSFSLVRILVYSVTIAMIYAISDEGHQTFVPGRDGRLRDVIIDTTGILTSSFVVKKRLK